MGERNIIKLASIVLASIAFSIDVVGVFHDAVIVLLLNLLNSQLLLVRRVQREAGDDDLLGIALEPNVRCTEEYALPIQPLAQVSSPTEPDSC